MSKREDFKKGLVVLGLSSLVAFGGAMGQKAEEEKDMSKYNIDNDKYEEYIKTDADKEILDRIEENVSRYKELKESKNSSKKLELEAVSNELKQSMSSGYLADFYLKNVFKGKLKNAYNVDKIETNYRSEDEFYIKLFDKYDRYKFMDKQDKILPIKNAMRDIATLQGYENSKNYSMADVQNFVKIYENMKGFSNLTFIKAENQPLKYAEIDLAKAEKNSKTEDTER